MALILNIDTATDIASVCISENGTSIAYRENHQQKEHASFVHAAINTILIEAGKSLQQIDAFAVTSGPGSYTGLRVGLATAKGFCFALNKPLITINTLYVMAQAAIMAKPLLINNLLYCPMIDARRMEVYTAIFNHDLQIQLQPAAIILESSTFDLWLQQSSILFFGSGSAKLKDLLSTEKAIFADIEFNAKNLARLAETSFSEEKFADVAYTEPDYIKNFFSTHKL
ncbi:MAG: tRNA (adenosine(37)-N6)-threonylcarbamoyltransferase complex dimerization subunit type 1 TsaB [Segetibacter sp.]|nr:tRNA (adenosine(37)-N6)-threonylcarbamoyltransferase complex dimerization subunit type 1 TsaB [Segetibacter sp.]